MQWHSQAEEVTWALLGKMQCLDALCASAEAAKPRIHVKHGKKFTHNFQLPGRALIVYSCLVLPLHFGLLELFLAFSPPLLDRVVAATAAAAVEQQAIFTSALST